MVNGHASQKLVAVDLDGTLIRGNSLRVYMTCALRDSLRRHRPWLTIRLGAVITLRALRLCSHRHMKWRVLELGGKSPALRDDFARHIRSLMRADVDALLKARADEGCRIVLATAAADMYIPWFWSGEFLATATDGNPAHDECRGTRKLKAVAAYAAANGLTLDTVITDHHDDLALLASGAPHRILVNPSSRTLAAVNMAGIHIDTILR